ncbi:MAG: hypothetical protein NWE89_02250 [Candidatus Bathyarchaeota archaeon]|nr:hypothetical protein [Candidatus Bathyarchaeota archaeon]
MTLDYVQTWTVKDGKEEEHDKHFKDFILKIGSNPYLKSIWFPPLSGASGRKGIVVYSFDDVEHWRLVRVSTLEDLRVLVRLWLQFIHLESYHIFFWGKK